MRVIIHHKWESLHDVSVVTIYFASIIVHDKAHYMVHGHMCVV